MGKYDYTQPPKININYSTAIKHLQLFLPDETKRQEHYKEYLKRALKIASIKLVNYQVSTRVNMEKIELLRDVIFIGSSFIEVTNNNHVFYRAVIASAFDIVEKALNVKFEDDFIDKITKSKDIYFDGATFNTVAFYLLFKSHFRYKKVI